MPWIPHSRYLPTIANNPVSPIELLRLNDLLSEEEQQIQSVVRKLVDQHVRPHVGGWYENANPPTRELAKTFGEVGLLGMHLTGYGCSGASAVAYGLACMELEAADSGVRSLVSVQGSLAMYAIWRWGSEEQKKQWLPLMAKGEAIGCFGLTEPDHGSDPSSMSTKARPENGEWVLHGAKTWITNAPIADIAVVWAKTNDDIRGFVVPTSAAGVTTKEIHHKLSLRASSTGEISLDNVRVPKSALLPDARGLRGPLSCLTQARYSIVWGALGAARDCLDTAMSYSLSRTQFDRPLASFQLTQAKLANMALELQKGFLLALHVGRMADQGHLTPPMVSAGKLNNVREALAIAHECRTILGANGISGEYPIMRHANNLESVLTYEGTSEIHQLILGEKLTGISAFN